MSEHLFDSHDFDERPLPAEDKLPFEGKLGHVSGEPDWARMTQPYQYDPIDVELDTVDKLIADIFEQERWNEFVRKGRADVGPAGLSHHRRR